MSKSCLLLLLTGIGALAGYMFWSCSEQCKKIEKDIEFYRQDGWFGNQKLSSNDKIPNDPVAIRPFVLNVSDVDLQDLRQRLIKSKYIDHIEGSNFEYGFNSHHLRKVVDYWLNKFNWRAQEKKINSFPQFITKIEGLDIHFLHVKPSKPAKTVIPLLAVHGWPGSFWEFNKLIPLLIEPVNGVAFEVVAPSIPGYGYSEAPHQTLFDAAAAARIFVKLMKRLNHEKFFGHGGDWGNFIIRNTGVIFPENLRGVSLVGAWFRPKYPIDYVKMLLGSMIPSVYFGAETAQKEYEKMFPLKEKLTFLLRETGYMHIQATKPDTVASALVDSPVGLAAYILEKFSTWTNPAYIKSNDGKITEKFTLDDLLTNIMIYWTSGNIASSQRFYKENLAGGVAVSGLSEAKCKVPASIIDPLHEFVRAPRNFMESSYENLIQYTDPEKGGHFLQFEEPNLVSQDIRSFISKVLQHEAEIKKQQSQKNKKVEI